jgi:hypothetical protein
MANEQPKIVFDGFRFVQELDVVIKKVQSGAKGVNDVNVINRMLEYREFGPNIIDSNEEFHDQTVRYLLVNLAGLIDQNAMYTQRVIKKAALSIMVPLWICAIALALLWLQGS